MDMLAQTYSKVDYDYEDALKYNYKEEHVKGIVDTMWSSNYNAIANCNYLLQNIEKKGSVMSERLRNVVEGEALALRAFLHFDLLRGYAPSYKMGKDEPAIPCPGGDEQSGCTIDGSRGFGIHSYRSENCSSIAETGRSDRTILCRI